MSTELAADPNGSAADVSEPLIVTYGNSINDATGGVVSMIHDCELTLDYVKRWRVPGGESHEKRYGLNQCVRVMLILIQVFSVGSAFFYFVESYNACVMQSEQLSMNIFAYGIASILITTIQVVKYVFCFRQERKGIP